MAEISDEVREYDFPRIKSSKQIMPSINLDQDSRYAFLARGIGYEDLNERRKKSARSRPSWLEYLE